MPKFLAHIRVNILRGLMAVSPLLLCVVAISLLYHLLNNFVSALLGKFVDEHQVPGLAVLLLFAFLFVMGIIAGNVMGRQALELLKNISARIPLVREIYAVSKQIIDTLASRPQGVFEKAVLVNYPNAGQWSVALVTGRIKDRNTGEDLLRVYIPLGHPLAGFVFIVREKQTLDPGWSIEEALKTVISLGIVAPEKI